MLSADRRPSIVAQVSLRRRALVGGAGILPPRNMTEGAYRVEHPHDSRIWLIFSRKNAKSWSECLDCAVKSQRRATRHLGRPLIGRKGSTLPDNSSLSSDQI